MRSLPALLIAALLAIPSLSLADKKAPKPIGLSAKKPKSGPYVKTEHGYMVPYKMKIPGTYVPFEMVPIPGGSLVVGDSPKNRVTVEIPPFWMGKYEVTWKQYKEYMALYDVFKQFESKQVRLAKKMDQLDAITAPTELYDPSFTFEFGEDPQQPAVTMTQYSAKQYTKWLSGVTGHFYRLPSEVEWEYACRGGAKTAYYFGDDAKKLGEHAWIAKNSGEMAPVVGQKKPNPFGLYDMHGCAAEWVLDQLYENRYERLREKGEKLTAAQAILKPEKLYPRICKGGSWQDEAEACRITSRLGSHDIDWKEEDPNLPLSPWWYTSDPSRGVGFRVLRALDTLSPEERNEYWKVDVPEMELDVEGRLSERRGVLGVVDPKLPEAIKSLDKKD